MTRNETQVYATGVLYQQNAFPANPKILFAIVDEKFRELIDLEYEFLSINRSENRFSNSTTREQLLIFMKGVKYLGNEYISDTNSANLRNALKGKLDIISELSYDDVEIRTLRETV